MGVIKVLTEGGQIWAHRFRMLRQVIKLTLLFSLPVGFVVFGLKMAAVPKNYYEGAMHYFKAQLVEAFVKEIEVSPVFWETATQGMPMQGTHLPVSKVLELSKPYVDVVTAYAYINLIKSLVACLLTSLGIVVFFIFKGTYLKGKHHISGNRIVSPWRIAFQLKCSNNASPIKIGGVPLKKNTETQHILITGGTGSGKTNCLHHILKQIHQIQHPALVIDTTGAFIDRYYDPKKDIIMNPFDTRSVFWHPWVECRDRFDYEALSESFIPNSLSEHENYWRSAGRSFFCSLLQKLADTQKTSELTRWLLCEPLSSVCNLVKGTKAAAHLDMSSEKTASSIRSVATTFLECLECLSDTAQPFSIRQWVTKNDKGWLFIQCTPAQRTALRPLLSAWISVAIRSLINLKPDFNRRLWFFLDELPTMQKIKDLETLLTEGRKYGGCGVLALQSPAQIEAIYGNETTQTIIGNTSTKIVFAEHDPEIAEKISKSFGEREVKEIQEGISYGANDIRDGVNLSWQTRHLPLVSATDIQSLDRHQAYLKLPGMVPCTKIKLSIAK